MFEAVLEWEKMEVANASLVPHGYIFFLQKGDLGVFREYTGMKL